MKQFLIAVSKRYPVLRIMRHYYVVVRNRVLWLPLALQPVHKRTIIFQAYNGRYACSPKALYQSMLYDPVFADFSFVWVVRDPKYYQHVAKQPRTRLVTYRSRDYFRAFATAKYWVVNCMLPLKIVKRPSQVMVQCWHGTPLKRLRADIIEDTHNAMNTRQDFIRKNRIDTVRYDYVVSPSRFTTEAFVSAFGIQKLHKRGRILEIGYPRNDALLTASPEKIATLKQQLELPTNKKIMLYAPTWRDDQHSARIGYTHDNQMDFDKLKAAIGDEYIVIFRAHYLIANRFNFVRHKGFVYDFSDHDDVNELFLVSDVLVTDYSSVLFDYANLGKPMVFFMYDREHYEQNLRGFYLDISKLPGEITGSQERLAAILKDLNFYTATHTRSYNAFAKQFVYLDDGHAAERLKHAVFDKITAPPGRPPTTQSQQPLTTKGPIA